MSGRLIGRRNAVAIAGLLASAAAAMAQEPMLTLMVAPSSDTGASSSDGITRDNTPKIGGTAPPNARIDVRIDGIVVARPTASWTGAWHATVPEMQDAATNIFARVINPTVGDYVSIPVVIDTQAPPVPTISVAGPTAKGANGAIITYDPTPTLTGLTEEGVIVEVRSGSLLVGTTTAEAGGKWTLTTSALSDGEHRLVARATDKAGNARASRLALKVTSPPPEAPTIVLQSKSDTGASTTDGVTNDATPNVKGTAPPRAKVSVLDGKRVAATTTASKLGAWKLTLPKLRDGSHQLWARVGTAMSATITAVVDTKAPKVPTIFVDDGLYTPTPALAGTTTARATVSVQVGATVIGSTEADGDGRWSFITPVLTPGSYWFSAFATDVAGNKSQASSAIQVVTDESTARPVTIDLSDASDTSRSDDNITRNREPTFVGTASPLAKVTVRDGDQVLGTTMADGSGGWSFKAPPLSIAAHALTASAAGHSSSPLQIWIGPGPAVIDLASLTAAHANRFNGASEDAFAGFSVATAGDVNADGREDFLISARNATPASARAVVYLMFGRGPSGWSAVTDLRHLTGLGVELMGADNLQGLPASGVGDVNADGFDDVAVAEGEQVYVVFGRETFPAVLDLTQVDEANGGAVLELSDHVGWVAPAGDVNGDGIADLIVDACGDAAVVFGRVGLASRESWDTLDGSDGFRFGIADDSPCSNGKRVTGVGDVNGDGLDDVAIAADGFKRTSDGEQDITGAVFVVYGREGEFPEFFQSSSEPTTYGFRVLGWFESRVLGSWVAGPGDVDGDGLGDLILSPGPEADVREASWVIYGKDDGYGGTLDLRSPPAGQVLILGGGHLVSALGDLDADDLADISVSAAGHWSIEGTTYILYGRDLRRTGGFDLTTLDGTEGLRIVGADPGDNLGYSLSTVTDSDGDGRDELLLGAPDAGPYDRSGAGSAYFVRGPGGI